jgi:hypothetical protein
MSSTNSERDLAKQNTSKVMTCVWRGFLIGGMVGDPITAIFGSVVGLAVGLCLVDGTNAN